MNDRVIDERVKQLKQGSKVEFTCIYGGKKKYTGRIEVLNDLLYWCDEYNYENNVLTPIGRGLKYYNPLSRFGTFTMFNIIK